MSESLSTLLLPRAVSGSMNFWHHCQHVSHTVCPSVRAQSVSQKVRAQPGKGWPRSQETSGWVSVRCGSLRSRPFPDCPPAARTEETSAAYSLPLHLAFSRLLVCAFCPLRMRAPPPPGVPRPRARAAALLALPRSGNVRALRGGAGR